MLNIKLNNEGLVRLVVNEDESKVIEFDPYDIAFLSGVNKISKIFTNLKSDDLDMLEEKFDEIEKIMKRVFGEKSIEYLFENRRNVTLYTQFFTQITPFVKQKRETLVNKYTN